MATIPSTFIQDLVARADVVEVVGRYVTLKKAGVNFKGLCPFHNEKSPSFTVSPVRQNYHCFGCGAHGDAISFLMEHNGLNFVEAVKDLAQQMGLHVPEENLPPEQQAIVQQRKAKQLQITDVLEKAAQHWQAALPRDQKAKAYIERRGLNQETVARYCIGFAAPGWQELQKAFPTNYDSPLLLEGGLVIDSEPSSTDPAATGRRYDRFRDRLMFPIKNIKGEVIGFGGRVLGKGEPKYLNSPETPVFSKGHELYGLFEARTEIRHHNYVLITEGYMDVVMLAQNGLTNAVATLGTACTEEHLQKIFKFTDNIVFSFDGDDAGRRAAERALKTSLQYAKDTRSIKFLFIPKEHDPDSYIQEYGVSAFKQAVAGALPLSAFLLELAQVGCDLSTPEGRARMLAQAYPLWGQFPQGALSIQLMGEIATAGQIATQDLKALWEQQTAQQAAYASQSLQGAHSSQGASAAYTPSQGGQSFTLQPPNQPSRWQRDVGGEYGQGRKNYSNEGGNRPWRGKNKYVAPQQPPMTAAQAPMQAVEYCIGALATHSQWWETVSVADQEMLCAKMGWHGAFFKWLERMVTDQGAMNWAAVSEAAKLEPWYDMLLILVEDVQFSIELEAGIDAEAFRLYLEHVRNEKTRAESARILQQFKLRR